MFFEVLPLCVPGTFSTGSFLCALMEVIPGLLLHSFKNVVNIHTILSSFFVSGLFTVTQHYCFLLLEIEREYKSISFQYCYDQHSMQKKKGRQKRKCHEKKFALKAKRRKKKKKKKKKKREEKRIMEKRTRPRRGGRGLV